MKPSILLLFLLLYPFGLLKAQIADYPPDCIGGQAEFKRVIRQEMLYPAKELQEGIGGKVLLSFIVYKNGRIDSLKVLEGISKDIDLEAQRLIRICQWKPAMIDGLTESTYCVKRIAFRSSQYKKWLSERSYEVEGKWPDVVYDINTSSPDPKFISGGTLGNFISRKLEYPAQAQSSGVEGTVKVRFVVEKTGRLTSVGIEEGVGGGCDEEALRVIRISKWKAGYFQGKPARVLYTVPIEFRINEIKASRSSFERY